MATSKRRAYHNTAHWKELGRFIDAYSHTETAMHLYLIYRTKVMPKIGNAIFAGTRVSDAIAAVRRISIVETGKDKLPTDLEDLFGHLQALNTARNDLVHYGASDFGEEYRLIMNWHRAHTDAAFKAIPIRLETIRNMTKDAEKAAVSLYWQAADAANRKRMEAGRALRRPWLYKPPQSLARTGQKREESRTYSQKIVELAKPSRK
jgi:hypothetical protein